MSAVALVGDSPNEEPWRRGRRAELGSEVVRMRHVLVVANRTLGGEELLRVVLDKASAEPTDFWLVVPATPQRSDSMKVWTAIGAGGGFPVDDDDQGAREAAEARLRLGIEKLRQAGATVDGEVGSPDPHLAVEDALAHHAVDEIVVSTLPSGMSHWLRLDLPKHLERKHHLPVTTVTARPAQH
jgi:GABA permease